MVFENFTSLNLDRIMNLSTVSGTSTPANPSSEFLQAVVGIPAAAGEVVNRSTAENCVAVFSAVNQLASDIAKMGLILRETSIQNGSQRINPALTDPLYTILKDVPNDYQTSFEFRYFLATQLIMNSNFYCQKITDQAGNILQLIPLDAWAMEVRWDWDAPLQFTKVINGVKQGVLAYHYHGAKQPLKFYAPQLWRGTRYNLDGVGYQGTPSIMLAKQAISVVLAAEKTAAKMMANGLTTSGFVSFPMSNDPKATKVDTVQAQNVLDQITKQNTGPHNAGRILLMPGGGTWQDMTPTAQEAQFLESRKWNAEDIARVYGGAPLIVKLGLGQQNSTYASSSAFLDEYFNTSLLPLTTIFEQTITRDLIPKEDWGKKYAKHNADVILRGAPDERAKTYQTLIQSFQMTPNEARILEDRDTIEGGDFLSGGTGTPVIFDIEKQEFFIPGQLPPQAMMDHQQSLAKTNAKAAADRAAALGEEPDASGGDDVVPPPTAKPQPKNKAQARLKQIANSLVERVMRKEGATKPDAKFVAEVLNVSKNLAEAYVKQRADLNDEQARTILLALAEGTNDEHNEIL